MNNSIHKIQIRNTICRKIERIILIFLIFIIIPSCALLYFCIWNIKLLQTCVVLLSLSGLIQLEISGLFTYLDYLREELDKSYEESGTVPSNITRIIYEVENPECRLNNYIFVNNRFGVSLLIFSLVLQLIITWVN